MTLSTHLPHNAGDIIAGRYHIVRYIDAGGMQFVYCAEDKTLKRFVALKTPKNISAAKRFRRSAVVAAKVNHPNVAKTLDYFVYNDREYLIEELICGENMSKSLISLTQYIDPFTVARIFLHLSKGLAASHHVGVVHRDLKPSNIIVTGNFNLHEIKITDFGIAKMAEEEINEATEGGEETISASATAIGALPYMAPEAIETPMEVGLKADIWSLGAMMYELLTGTLPFGKGLRAVNAILSGRYNSMPSFVYENPQFRHLTLKLTDLIAQCLSLNDAARPSADDLIRYCSQLCYPVRERYLGTVTRINYDSYGFIGVQNSSDAFFHMASVYGEKPAVGDNVILSKFDGGGNDRALPVIKQRTHQG